MKRHGSTLLEAAMLMPAFGMLLILSVMGTRQIMQLSKYSKHRTELSLTLGRLEQQFRTDVTNATEVELKGDVSKQKIVLTQWDGSTVTYQAEPHSLRRDKLDSNGQGGVENYALFPQALIEYQLISDQTPPGQPRRAIVLSVSRAQQDDPNLKRLELRISATVGRLQLPSR